MNLKLRKYEQGLGNFKPIVKFKFIIFIFLLLWDFLKSNEVPEYTEYHLFIVAEQNF